MTHRSAQTHASLFERVDAQHQLYNTLGAEVVSLAHLNRRISGVRTCTRGLLTMVGKII